MTLCKGMLLLDISKAQAALTSVAELAGHHLGRRKVNDLIPGPEEPTCLGCKFGPQSGHMQEATD